MIVKIDCETDGALPVHTLPLVLPDPNADIAAGDDLPEVRQVDPVLQVVS